MITFIYNCAITVFLLAASAGTLVAQQQGQPLQAPSAVSDSQAVQHVDAKTFKKLISKKDGIVLDVRTPEEHKQGHVAGAINLNLFDDNFEKRLSTLDKNQTYYVYCASGGRSSEAAEAMKKAGFKRIINLQRGGYKDIK